MRYEAVKGFNTKQWWIYDNEEDVMIDPPSYIHNLFKKYVPEAEQEKAMRDILKEAPEWLMDENNWYDENKISDI